MAGLIDMMARSNGLRLRVGPVGQASQSVFPKSRESLNLRVTGFMTYETMTEGRFPHCLHGGACAREGFEVKDEREALAAFGGRPKRASKDARLTDWLWDDP
jgi:hypothetical protein